MERQLAPSWLSCLPSFLSVFICVHLWPLSSFPHPQRLGTKGDGGEVARRVAVQVSDNALRRQGVQRRLDLVETAHPAEVVPVGGQCPRSRRRGLLLLDQRGLQPDADALDLVRLNAILQPRQLAQCQIERALSAVVGGARVTENAGAVLVGLIARRDGVTQPVLLAYLSKQSSAHSAIEDVNCSEGVVVVRVAERHALVGDADLRLRRLLLDVTVLPGGRGGTGPDDRLLAAFPVAE